MFASRLLLGSLLIYLTVGIAGCGNKEDLKKETSTTQATPAKEASAATTSEELPGLAELKQRRPRVGKKTTRLPSQW